MSVSRKLEQKVSLDLIPGSLTGSIPMTAASSVPRCLPQLEHLLVERGLTFAFGL